MVAARRMWLVFLHREDHKTMMVCSMELAKTMVEAFQTWRNDLATALRMTCVASVGVGMREHHIERKAVPVIEKYSINYSVQSSEKHFQED